MEDWRAITEDDVQSIMNSAEDNAVRAKYLATGQSDPLVSLIAKITRKFRSAIRSNRENQLHPDERFLPEDVIGDASTIIRHELLGRFGVAISEGRMASFREANKTLTEIKNGTLKITLPGPEGDVAPVPIPPLAINRQRRANPHLYEDGI